MPQTRVKYCRKCRKVKLMQIKKRRGYEEVIQCPVCKANYTYEYYGKMLRNKG